MKKAKYCQNCGELTCNCACPPSAWKRYITRPIKKILHYTDITILLLIIGIIIFGLCQWPDEDANRRFLTNKTIERIGDVKFYGIKHNNDLEVDLLCTLSLYQYSYDISISNNGIIQTVVSLPCEQPYKNHNIAFIRCDQFNVSININNTIYLIYEWTPIDINYWLPLLILTPTIIIGMFITILVDERHDII